MINSETCGQVVESDSHQFIRLAVQGEDLRPWYQEDEGRWLVVVPSGWTRQTFGSGLTEEQAWDRFSSSHPALAGYLQQFATAARKRQDKGEYWWELRPCDYYDAFDKPKIFWPDISKLPRFSWDDSGKYITNTGYIIPESDPSLLAILQSRVTWFAISQICQPLRLRAGLWQYRVLPQFVDRLPIPDLTSADKELLGNLAISITEYAQSRYSLHESARHRILTDLGRPDGKLNQKLTAWWDLDFPTLRAEIKKVFKHDIPVGERDEWESWLEQQRTEHQRLTDEIVRLETELNGYVYRLFDLTAEEIQTIEEVTKYSYGEV